MITRLIFAATACLFSLQPLLAQGHYQVSAARVLAKNSNYQFTEGHFQKSLRFVEFVLGVRLSESQVQAGRDESIQDFQDAPGPYLQEIDQLDATMQQLYALSDPVQIALVRSTLIYEIYALYAESGEQGVFLTWLEQYVPILAYDPEHQLVFTGQDFEGFVAMLGLQYQFYGQPFSMDTHTKIEYQNALIQYFEQGDLATRQYLCSLGELGKYMTRLYKAMPEEKQLDYQLLYLGGGSVRQEEVDTPSEKRAYLEQRRSDYAGQPADYRIISELMQQSHVSMLNVIENLGDSGDYWEIRYSDY